MKTPCFIEGVIVALVMSLSTSLLHGLLSPFLPTQTLLRLLITGMTLAYVIYLIMRSYTKVGRIVCLLMWLIISSVCWLTTPSLTVYLMLHIGLIWLIRSLYFYNSLVASLSDLIIGSVGLVAMLWAIAQTDSWFLASWCFFLIQALFVGTPKTLKKPVKLHSPDHQRDFQRAQQRAKSAIRSLHTLQ